MKAITESTLIPISLVITVAGGAFWLSSVKSRVDETSASVQKMEAKLDKLASMQTDIEVIKTKLEGLERPVRSASADTRSIRRTLQFTVPAKFAMCPHNPAIISMNEKGLSQGE